jgi:hypothetical protein
MLQLLDDEPIKESFRPFKVTPSQCSDNEVYIDGLHPLWFDGENLGCLTYHPQVVRANHPALADSGLIDICKPCLEFLTVALVKPSSIRDTLPTVQSHVGRGGYDPIPAGNSF